MCSIAGAGARPGYDVTVNKTGFAPYDVKEIDLEVGQNVNIVVSLSLPEAGTTVQVEGAAPLVETPRPTFPR